MTTDLELPVGEAGIARQRDVAMGIQRRLVAHLRDKSTDRAPTTMVQGKNAYTSEHRHAQEMEKLFHSLPLLAGLSRDLPEIGSKMLFEEVGTPILIVRPQSGGLRAYLNMCRHRAAKLVTDCTTAKRMSCPFHAWTYNLDGDLIAMPGAQGFDGLEKSDLGLIEVPVEEWHGLIFVIARPGTAADIDVATYLGTMAPELAQLDLGHAQPVKTDRLDAACNWKYAYDTYGEGYHFSTLHPTSIGRIAHSDMMVHDRFGLHARINFPYRDQDLCLEQPEEDWVRRPYGGIHLIFPNTVLQIATFGPGNVFGLYRMYPDKGPNHAFSMMSTYRSGAIPADTDMQPWVDQHDFIMNVVRTEDYSVSATGQTNLVHAPAGFEMLFGNNEGVLQDFHRNLARIIGSDDAGRIER